MSKILRDVHEAARDLYAAGMLPKTTMREFDALCLHVVKSYTAKGIRRMRRKARVSQAVFAHFLNVGKTTVQQWEQGHKRPNGAALKLLELVDRKGLGVLA